MAKQPFNNLSDARQDEDTVYVDLWYPRVSDNRNFIEVGLFDVRAADNVRISYDFDRDGWLIEQAKFHSWEADDEECDPEWTEAAFVQAWGNEVKRPWDDNYKEDENNG